MKWNVRLAKDAARQLERVPRDYHELLLKKLREMVEDPFQGDVVPLKGKEWKGSYRKRVGKVSHYLRSSPERPYRRYYSQFLRETRKRIGNS